MSENILKDLNELNIALSTPQRKRVKKAFQGKVDIKQLLKHKTLKKIDEDNLTLQLEAALPQLERELKKYFDGNSKIIDDEQTLTEIFTNKKFSKAICKILDENEDVDNKVIFYVISELWISNNKAFSQNKKLVTRYLKAFSKVEKKRIKKVSKILDISKNDAIHFVLGTLHYKGAKFKTMKKRFQTFLTLSYQTKMGDDGETPITTKQITKLIDLLFKDCKTQFYNYALGERERNNNPSFDVVTKAVLRGIEKMDRDKIKDLLKNFAKRRLKNKNMNRRVSLLSLNSNDYPNICKVVKKLISTGMGKDLFN